MDSSTRRFDPQDAPPVMGQFAPVPRPPTAPLLQRDPRAVLEPLVRRNTNLIAFGLIALGLSLFFGHGSVAAAFGACIPLVIGAVLLYVYEDKGRPIGFLVPGAILTGLGLGGFVGMLLGLPGLFLIGMGLGFAAIWHQYREHWWALLPGGIMTVAGLSVTFAGHTAAWMLPLLLIGGGLWLFARQRTRAIRH
jgi:hypothetical protein